MNNSEWLQQLKVGDEVFVSRPNGYAPYPGKVIRITKAQIVIFLNGHHFEDKFWKRNGNEVGGDIYGCRYLIMPSDDVRENVDLEKLKNKANELREKIISPRTKAELQEFIVIMQKYLPGRDKP